MTNINQTTFTNSTKNTKILITAAVLSGLLITNNSYAAEADPCGAELCLSGLAAAGGNIKECKVHVKKFFSIKGFKKGIFVPAATYAMRYKWLNQCKGGNKAFRLAIMNVYGNLPYLPFG